MSAGHLMLDLLDLTLQDNEKSLLLHPEVGGVILFSRNFESADQVTALVSSIREVRAELLICVDQEGGRVQRFKAGFTLLPPMQLLGDMLEIDPAATSFIKDVGWLMAVELLACGLDFSFAPVLDIDRDHCAVIANRSFGETPQRVIDAAGAFIEGMAQAGMPATGKHFPGHGGVRGDSHFETPIDERGLSELTAHDIKPFAALANNLHGIMPAHIVFPAVDKNAVGFSPFWLQQVLRGDLAYQGVIFSDDLSMKGADVAGGYTDKARLALEAGCDMVLVCNNPVGALEVLDYLEAGKLPSNGRLPSMQASKQWTWQELSNNERWQVTTAKLKTIASYS